MSWLVLVVSVLLGAGLLGCESRAEKLQQCRATCDDLDREYRAQCTGIDAEGCLHNVEQHHDACRRICDMESLKH